jgi:hypothetical protein
MADILFNPERFEQAQRVASMLVQSPLVPDHIRGKTAKEGVANVVMSIAMAQEMGENPIIVMQSIYFVGGKAGWSAQYMIARANRSGVFQGAIRFRTAGAGKDLSVTAYATLKGDTEPVEATADMKMAEAEGWTRNPKYKSMAEHMLTWRAATFLIRRYAPQVMLGYHTSDELEDIAPAVSPRRIAPSSTAALVEALDVKGEEAERDREAEAEDVEVEREPGED